MRYFAGHYLGQPGLADYPDDSQSPDILILSIYNSTPHNCSNCNDRISRSSEQMVLWAGCASCHPTKYKQRQSTEGI